MTIERTFYCDTEGCERHARTQRASHPAMLTVTGDGRPRHFCGWDCLMKFAAQFEPPEIIPMGDA